MPRHCQMAGWLGGSRSKSEKNERGRIAVQAAKARLYRPASTNRIRKKRSRWEVSRSVSITPSPPIGLHQIGGEGGLQGASPIWHDFRSYPSDFQRRKNMKRALLAFTAVVAVAGL